MNAPMHAASFSSLRHDLPGTQRLNRTCIIFQISGKNTLAESLAEEFDAELGSLAVQRFPDEETYVRADSRCDGANVLLVADMCRPDSRVLPLIFAADALRSSGARRIILVAPYLPYLRQDARFQPGEAITSRVFAQLLSTAFDGLVTIDPHLHRYNSLNEPYSIPASVGHAAPAIAEWILKHVTNPLIVGPDMESEQWVSNVAGLASAPFVISRKFRHGDRDVRVSIPDVGRWRHHRPVLIDDIISTAHTMAEAVSHLLKAGLPAPVCIGVHAIFAANAHELLGAAGAARVVTCNTIEHSTNAIDTTEALIAPIRELMRLDKPMTLSEGTVV